MRALERFLRAVSRCFAIMALPLCSLVGLAQESAPNQANKIIVADVVPQGSRLVSAQQIMAYLKTRPGSEYKVEVIQEDVRTLYATKQFANIEVVPRTEPDGQVTVFFLIRDYPSKVENVVYQGAKHLKDDDLAELTNIRKGINLNPCANKLACQAIVRKYNEQGRPFAACELLKGEQPGDTEVLFNITEGPIIHIHSIRIKGADTLVGSLVLLTHSDSWALVQGLVNVPFSLPVVDAGIAKLEDYYKKFGYLGVRISRELNYSVDGKEVDVVFHVHEGICYQIKDIKTSHNQADKDADISRISDFVGWRGHEVQGRATPDASTDTPGLVNLHYDFVERMKGTGFHGRSVRIIEGEDGVSDTVTIGPLNTWWKILWLFGSDYDQESPAVMMANLKECYKEIGYLDVQIRRESQFSPDGQEREVVFRIQKGNRYPVQQIQQGDFGYGCWSGCYR